MVDAWNKRIPPEDTDADNFIQWKGTDVCMDFYCVCGEHGHYDGMFAYYVGCEKCGRVYELGTRVHATLTTLTLSDNEVKILHNSFKHPDDPDYQECHPRCDVGLTHVNKRLEGGLEQ